MASGHALDRLTTLFVYIVLAVMWNAMSGYGGLVSVGQQVFFGLGAYCAVRLSSFGVNPYVALLVSPLAVGLIAVPLSSVALRLKGGEFAIGMWVVAELCRLLVNLDPLVQGDTGTSLIALQSYAADSRRAYTYWLGLSGLTLTLGALFALLRSPIGAAMQAIRDSETAAESVGVRAFAVKRTIFVFAAVGTAIAGAIWLANTTTFQPRSLFRGTVDGLHDLHGARRRHRAFRGPDTGRGAVFSCRIVADEAGVWYLVSIGMFALIASLYLPKGVWGVIEDRLHLQLLPIGYRLDPSGAANAHTRADPSSPLLIERERGALWDFLSERMSAAPSPTFGFVRRPGRPASSRRRPRRMS